MSYVTYLLLARTVLHNNHPQFLLIGFRWVVVNLVRGHECYLKNGLFNDPTTFGHGMYGVYLIYFAVNIFGGYLTNCVRSESRFI